MEKRSTVAAWFTGRIPDGWFVGPPEVVVDREEILVVGEVAAPELGDEADDDARAAARLARARRFREETREARIAIAAEAEHRFDRKVSWGVACGGDRFTFTSLAVPVMTRLRIGERAVLDTLLDAGVARSRSEALAWCVRLVERNQSEWIGALREALVQVERTRAEGPAVD
jgi:hypothetical protein